MGPESPGIDQPPRHLSWGAHLESNYSAITASKSSPSIPRNSEAHCAVGVPDSDNTFPPSGSASLATQTFVTQGMPTAPAISHAGREALSQNVSPFDVAGATCSPSMNGHRHSVWPFTSRFACLHFLPSDMLKGAWLVLL